MLIRYIIIAQAIVFFFSCNSEKKTDSDKLLLPVMYSERDSIHVKESVFCFSDTTKSFFESIYKNTLDTSEKNCLQKVKEWVQRYEDTLLVKLNNGTYKKYINNSSIESDNYTTFQFISKLNSIDYYLIKIYYYEGFSYLMLNTKTGHENYLWGLPAVSPDNSKIMAACFDLQAGFVFNGLQYFDITPDSLHLIWSRELSKWGADNIAWANNNLLVAEQINIDSSYNTKTKYITISQCN